jgi:hypothetical protein
VAQLVGVRAPDFLVLQLVGELVELGRVDAGPKAEAARPDAEGAALRRAGRSAQA